MEKWRKRIAAYFLFSKKERTGLGVLLILLFLTWFLPEFFAVNRVEVPEKDASQFQKEITKWYERDSQLSQPNKENNYSVQEQIQPLPGQRHEGFPRTPVKLFYFDPNTLSDSDWISLGLPIQKLLTIRRYQAKGGRFRKPEDLAKIYGLSGDWLKKVIPFVRLPEMRKVAEITIHDTIWNKAGPTHSRRRIPDYFQLDINQSDSAAWVALPGIGPKLAGRILRFRENLGGFYSLDQVAEVYGLPDSTFLKIRPFLRIREGFVPRQISVNTADVQELAAHPYLNYNVAKVIFTYRREHGPYESIGALARAGLLSPQIMQRLSHYLKIN